MVARETWLDSQTRVQHGLLDKQSHVPAAVYGPYGRPGWERTLGPEGWAQRIWSVQLCLAALSEDSTRYHEGCHCCHKSRENTPRFFCKKKIMNNVSEHDTFSNSFLLSKWLVDLHFVVTMASWNQKIVWTNYFFFSQMLNSDSDMTKYNKLE